MLNIWGVMLFIRMSWIVGQAGIGECCPETQPSSGVFLERIREEGVCLKGPSEGVQSCCLTRVL